MPDLVPIRSQNEFAAHLKAIVVDSVRSPHSKRAYARALDHFFVWWIPSGLPFTKATVAQYRAFCEGLGWAPSTINVHIGCVRRLAVEASDNGFLAADIAGAVGRVQNAKNRGVRVGNWLTKEQVQAILAAPKLGTLKGIRDRAILALLIGCGLRREECSRLKLDDIQQRDGRWVIVDLIGKGQRVRSVPVPAWVKVCVDCWTEIVRIKSGTRGLSGEETGCEDSFSILPARFLLRSIGKGGALKSLGLTPQAIWDVVQKYSLAALGFVIAPHDLRRTCAKLCRSAGGDLEQIQLLLGHASVQTTERYLGTKQSLVDAPNDHLGIVID